MKTILILLSLLILTTSSFAQVKLPIFDAAVIENEDPDEIESLGTACSFYCAGFTVIEKASSSLPHRDKLRYGAAQAHDFNLNTAWVEGVEGDGVGESLEYAIDASQAATKNLKVTALTIFNGYRKSRELWQDNSRVKQLKMYVDGKPSGIINLKDAYNFQTVEVGTVELSPRRKTTLRFEIMQVYKGKKYSDTAITEIELDGCCVH